MREISVAFDLHLRYTTEYTIASSRYLKGFTELHISNDCCVEVVLNNPYVDVRNDVSGGYQYRLFIFDYDANTRYMLEGYGEVNGKVSDVVFDSEYSGATPHGHEHQAKHVGGVHRRLGTIQGLCRGEWHA